MVTALAGECECGRPFRLIESIEGRIEDVLHFNSQNDRTGRVAIHPNVFHHVLESVPADGWQVEQEMDGVSVWLVGARDPSLFSALATQIGQALEAQGARLGTINVRASDSLRRGATGKAPLILARR